MKHLGTGPKCCMEKNATLGTRPQVFHGKECSAWESSPGHSRYFYIGDKYAEK